jgi:hypothetical protein
MRGNVSRAIKVFKLKEELERRNGLIKKEILRVKGMRRGNKWTIVKMK